MRALNSKVYSQDGIFIGSCSHVFDEESIVVNGKIYNEYDLTPYSIDYAITLNDQEFHYVRSKCMDNYLIRWDRVVVNNKWKYLVFSKSEHEMYVSATEVADDEFELISFNKFIGILKNYIEGPRNARQKTGRS
jgi:hypothetical protein